MHIYFYLIQIKLVLLLECDTPRARCFKEVRDSPKGTACVGFCGRWFHNECAKISTQLDMCPVGGGEGVVSGKSHGHK